MMNSKAILAVTTAIAVVVAMPAYAAQLEFDCDVPADHFSSVSQDVADGGGVSGTIRVDEMRKGNNLPVVGAGIFGPEKRAIAGFQLVAADARSKKFDIIFNVSHDGGTKKAKVGEVNASAPIAFNISLSATGKAVLIMKR